MGNGKSHSQSSSEFRIHSMKTPQDEETQQLLVPTVIDIHDKEKPRTFTQMLPIYGILLSVQFMNGGYHVLSKVALKEGIDPFIFTLIRDLMAIPFFFIVAVFLDGVPTAHLRDVPVFAALGFFGVFGNQNLFISGVKYTNPDNAAVFQPLIPVLTTFMSLLIGRESLQWKQSSGKYKLVGIIVSIIAIAGMIAFQSTGDNVLLGNLCLVGNCICFSIFVLLQKEPLSRYTPAQLTLYSFVFGSCFVVLLNIPSFSDPANYQFSGVTWIALSYTAFVTSGIAFLLVAWCNQRVSSVVVTSFWAAQPPSTSLLALLVLDDKPSLVQGVGGLLLIVGLCSVCWAKYQDQLVSAKGPVPLASVIES